MSKMNASRREFLRAASLVSMVGPAGAPLALNLAGISAAMAQSATDYKALVCLFLFGGNDHGNTVIATDATSWAEYQRLRGTPPDPIALAGPGVAGGVLPIVPATDQPGRTFGLHPNLGPLKDLFDSGRAAVIANVGPLIAPITKAQYTARSVPLPVNLFSHNDQSSTWQANASEGAHFGWGGRMGDLLASMNTNTTFTCISAAGNAIWLSGQSSVQYQVGSNGAVAVGGLTGSLFGSSTAPAILKNIVTADRAHLFEKEVNRITARSIVAQALLNASMIPSASLEAIPLVPGTNQTNSLAAQLNTVARIIGGRSALGAKRQVFFVSMGGFDTHDAERVNHANLMTKLAQAMAYFDRLMASQPVNAQNQVTLFTGSDFGRTLTSNGDGTDHGWGSHHFVMGGAVKGKDLYGRFPITGVNTTDDVGQGRLLPVNSVDQYGGTLAKWFGLTDTQIADVIPNIVNYGSARDLGFMLPG